MPRLAQVPSSSCAARQTGITEAAVSRAWATSNVSGVGKIRKNGASRPTMGWK